MARQQAPLPRRVRALLGFVCALVFVDTIFFTALTPLLPHYTDVANLTKAGAGLLVAAYPAGTLVGTGVTWRGLAQDQAGSRHHDGRRRDSR